MALSTGQSSHHNNYNSSNYLTENYFNLVKIYLSRKYIGSPNPRFFLCEKKKYNFFTPSYHPGQENSWSYKCFRSNVVVLLYLTIDAAHLGLLSSVWSMAFLTERMPRMILMIFLFPLISFGLCAWMAVFGFYLRLEEAAWARYCDKGFHWD